VGVRVVDRMEKHQTAEMKDASTAEALPAGEFAAAEAAG
jgi:hypothetical protein